MRAVLTLVLSVCLGYVAAGTGANVVSVLEEQCATCPDSVEEAGTTYNLIFSDAGTPGVDIFCGYESAQSSASKPDQIFCSYHADGKVFGDGSASCPKTTTFGQCNYHD
ncbi:hypothetical protein BS17DRAFT_811016 [Gyrodon lividus]|nr:hypothetical protein BS17DRAFT_811016 [Gyrodon lividus]